MKWSRLYFTTLGAARPFLLSVPPSAGIWAQLHQTTFTTTPLTHIIFLRTSFFQYDPWLFGSLSISLHMLSMHFFTLSLCHIVQHTKSRCDCPRSQSLCAQHLFDQLMLTHNSPTLVQECLDELRSPATHRSATFDWCVQSCCALRWVFISKQMSTTHLAGFVFQVKV